MDLDSTSAVVSAVMVGKAHSASSTANRSPTMSDGNDKAHPKHDVFMSALKKMSDTPDSSSERFTPLYVEHIGGVVIDEKDGSYFAETKSMDDAEAICKALNTRPTANAELVDMLREARKGKASNPNHVITVSLDNIDELLSALTSLPEPTANAELVEEAINCVIDLEKGIESEIGSAIIRKPELSLIKRLVNALTTAPEPSKITCHAEGDRCLGCDHYHGKSPVCKYAPEPDSNFDMAKLRILDRSEYDRITGEPQDRVSIEAACPNELESRVFDAYESWKYDPLEGGKNAEGYLLDLVRDLYAEILMPGLTEQALQQQESENE